MQHNNYKMGLNFLFRSHYQIYNKWEHSGFIMLAGLRVKDVKKTRRVENQTKFAIMVYFKLPSQWQHRLCTVEAGATLWLTVKVNKNILTFQVKWILQVLVVLTF